MAQAIIVRRGGGGASVTFDDVTICVCDFSTYDDVTIVEGNEDSTARQITA